MISTRCLSCSDEWTALLYDSSDSGVVPSIVSYELPTKGLQNVNEPYLKDLALIPTQCASLCHCESTAVFPPFDKLRDPLAAFALT